MEVAFIAIGLIGSVIFGFLACYFGAEKGRGPAASFCLGFFLGVIGLIIVLLLPSKKAEESRAVNDLMNYKQLLDAGLITKAEFEEKKAKVLGSGAVALSSVPVLYREQDGEWREYWVCPHCSRTWYIADGAQSGRCGNNECALCVSFDR